MSLSHHGTPEETEARDRLLDQFLHRSKPAFPRGRIHKEDEGELAFAIAADPKTNTVVVHFGKPVDWIGLAKKDALHLVKMLTEKAETLK